MSCMPRRPAVCACIAITAGEDAAQLSGPRQHLLRAPQATPEWLAVSCPPSTSNVCVAPPLAKEQENDRHCLRQKFVVKPAKRGNCLSCKEARQSKAKKVSGPVELRLSIDSLGSDTISVLIWGHRLWGGGLGPWLTQQHKCVLAQQTSTCAIMQVGVMGRWTSP